MTKKVLRTYVRQNEDWTYINYLENRITEMKNELKIEKALIMITEKNKSLKNELLNEYINNLP